MLKSIQESLSGIVQKLGINSKNWALLSLVEQECASLGSGVQVVGFKGNKIYIEVESSTQLQELAYRKREILKRIQRAFPDDTQTLELKFFMKGMSRPTRMERMNHTFSPKSFGKK